jgi:DNA polymerase-3 subunit alpha (Gram-positive type)
MNHNSSVELLSELSFCVIDLETTGGNHQHDKIFEIGMVRIENLKIVDEKHLLLNPEILIPEFIQKLTGTAQHEVENCPTIEETITEILEFIGDSILIAHNASFDVPFLNSVLRRLGLNELENKVICTNVMTKYLIPDVMNSNLNYLSQLFDIRLNKAHQAIEDARATAELLLKYLNIYIEKGIRKINQLYYPKNKFELDRINLTHPITLDTLKNILLKSEASKIVTFKGEQGSMLAIYPTRSNSKEMIKITEDFFNELKWEMITIKLIGPYIEGLSEYNMHLSKLMPEITETINQYIESELPDLLSMDESISFLQQIDFLVTPHLIKEQLVSYSFFQHSNKNKLVFKYPTHKKKFTNHCLAMINRLKKGSKAKKLFPLNSQVTRQYATYLKSKIESESNEYLVIKIDDIIGKQKEVYKEIDRLIATHPDRYQFPVKYL